MKPVTEILTVWDQMRDMQWKDYAQEWLSLSVNVVIVLFGFPLYRLYKYLREKL